MKRGKIIQKLHQKQCLILFVLYVENHFKTKMILYIREFERALRKEEEDVKDMEQAMNQQLRLQQ
ncbi:MAG: hypothetical protein ACJ712_05855 [Nitrososphaeraceae archaeon]